MTAYEYRIEYHDWAIKNRADIEAKMSALGKDGWELVCTDNFRAYYRRVL